MNAVILAAGAATRLRPLTARTPKCLLPVAGTPILRRLLEHLAALDVRDVTIVTGYLEAAIRDALARWRPPLAIELVPNRAFATTNNACSTLLARPAVDGRPFLLLDADIVCDREVIAAVLDADHPDALALRPSRALGAEEMKVVVGAGGRVVACRKDVDPALAAGESIGINRFSAAGARRFFEVLADRVVARGLVHEWNDAAVQQMIDEDGYDLRAVDVGGWFCAEIDTPDDLATVDRLVRAHGG